MAAPFTVLKLPENQTNGDMVLAKNVLLHRDSELNPIIRRVHEILLRSEVALRCLNGCVPEQQLNVAFAVLSLDTMQRPTSRSYSTPSAGPYSDSDEQIM